jgi:flavin reductase (DIM6/NTAB) family NADH-FMN oxidoreductase RutF
MSSKLRLLTAPADAGVRHGPDPGAFFGEAMSALASGVVVVTCRVDGRVWGTTVTAFASVSADPPTVLVSLDSGSRAAQAIAETGAFGVSLLAADQTAVARFCAQPGAAKFLDPSGEAFGGALAQLDCDVSDDIVVADHTVFFGRVVAAHAAGDADPLVYHRRGYRRIADMEESATCAAS